MNQKSLAKWLKAVIICCAAVALIVFGWVIPAYGANFASLNPEVAYCYYPWLIFSSLFSLPCFGVLFLGWKVASNISKNNSFSFENARHLKKATVLTAADTAFWWVGNWVLVFLDMNHPGVALIFAPLLAVFGLAFAVGFAVLSHLCYKSAEMKAESDLTI